MTLQNCTASTESETSEGRGSNHGLAYRARLRNSLLRPPATTTLVRHLAVRRTAFNAAAAVPVLPMRAVRALPRLAAMGSTVSTMLAMARLAMLAMLTMRALAAATIPVFAVVAVPIGAILLRLARHRRLFSVVMAPAPPPLVRILSAAGL